MPAGIDKVVVTASLDGSGPATFGAVGSLVARVLDASGTPAVEFPVSGLGAEKALVCVEVYRRQGAWKVRAVGQGYADGLAGIATDFGITVDDAPPPAAAPAPAVAPPRHRRPLRGCRAASGRVNLDKGRVSLAKQQTVSLVKTGAPALTRVRMGLGWDPARRAPTSTSTRRSSRSTCAARTSRRSGTATSRASAGRSATPATTSRARAPATTRSSPSSSTGCPRDVEGLVFTVNSYRGQKFTELKTAYCRLLDDRGHGARPLRPRRDRGQDRRAAVQARP